jgi:phage terminase Nu1 subunit (DNA packaging protein)
LKTNRELAEAAGVSIRTVQRMRKAGVDVADLAAVRRWQEDHNRVLRAETLQVMPGLVSPTGIPTTASLTEARRVLAEAQARAVEQRRAREAGDLMPRAEIQRLIRDSWGPVSSFLATLPASWPSRFTADPTANSVVLGELARTIRKLCRDGAMGGRE